ncbi:MAG: nucleoside hydrolase [Gammaproteobacteria bacterium]
MSTLPVILDCDPGQDDAVMLLLALAYPQVLNVTGITTVAGNVALEKTQRNARIMCELARRPDVPVHAGCAAPMLRPLVTAEHVHGSEGIDGATIYEPELPLQPVHAVDFIVRTLLAAADDSLTLVATGPLTNVAMAIVREPAIVPKIKQIVYMGGAWRKGGNVTPCAEFNVYVDPHAASVVFGCGRPLVVMSLDITHQVLTTAARREAIGRVGNRAAAEVKAMLEFYNRHDSEKYGIDGGPLHDPCTVAYLLRPELFATKHVNVAIETGSALTLGATVVDYWGVTQRPPNVQWADKVDVDGFFELLNESLARYS